MTTIAFFGLGHMGAPMVQHLAKASYQVRAFDVSDSARKALQANTPNLQVVETASDAIQDASIVISMLSSAQQVSALYLGTADAGIEGRQLQEDSQPQQVSSEQSDHGIFHALKKGTLVIDCTTIAVSDAKRLAIAAQKHGLEFVEAPVSGSIAGAKSGNLTFIVGGSDAGFEAAKTPLLAMGNKLFHAGSHGAGQAAKICNNMMLGILMSGSAETLNLGIKNGVDPAVLTDIMIHSSGRNWALEVYNPYPQVLSGVPASKEYSGGFSSQNMYKDLNLALQVAEASGVDVPIGKRATELYNEHVTEYAHHDFSSIMVRYDGSVIKS